MRRSQVLEYWMSRYGSLSPASQQRFLRRKETFRLARYPDEIVRRSINWSNLLADALNFAHSAYEGEASSRPADPHTPSRPGRTQRVAEASRKRDPERERRIAHTIGPVQNYDDSF
jgi:hypothetical protein